MSNCLKKPDLEWPCYLLGRSAEFSMDTAVSAWSTIAAAPGFSSTQAVRNRIEVTTWNVDRLVSMANFTGADGVRGKFVLRPGAWSLERGCELFQKFPWLENYSFSGELQGGNHVKSSIWVSVHTFGANLRVSGSRLAISDVKDGASAAEKLEFHRLVLGALGMEGMVQFDKTSAVPSYKVLNRDADRVKLAKVGWSDDAEGAIESSLTFAMEEKSVLLDALHKILGCWPDLHLVWTDAGFSARTAEGWEEAYRWLNGQQTGAWEQFHSAAASAVWTLESFLEKGTHHDVIPAGRFDFPRGKSGAAIPAALRGRSLHVDLFKEGNGWHFAFHLVEQFLEAKKREPIRQALNALLGSEFITRTPEMLWPAAYPS